jgi:octaprenyl-diphosphate synthase
MSVGELRQLYSFDALQFSERDYDRLIASKTASLMSAACELGAAAGAPMYRTALAQFGHALGMAFQIADDLLDYTGTAEEVGKPTGLDLREHKVTLPLIAALPGMAPAERSEVEAFFADPVPTDDGITRVMELVVEHDGLEYARRRAEEFGETATEALRSLPDSESVRALQDAVAYVIGRRR